MSVVSHYQIEPLEAAAEYENMIYQPGIGKKTHFSWFICTVLSGTGSLVSGFLVLGRSLRAKGFNIYIPELEICFECIISQQSVIIVPIILRQLILPSGYKKN